MEISKSRVYKYIKKSQFFFFLKQRLFDKDYKENLIKMKDCSKPISQIKKEMELIKQYWHCKPYHYVRYGLYDCDLTEDQLLDYIPSYYHYNFYINPLYKNLDSSLYDNKLSLYYIFKEKKVKTPEVIAVVKGRNLYDLCDNKIDCQSFFEKNNGTLFFKPVNGRGGSGIKVFSNGSYIHFMNTLNKHIIYVVQNEIKQREDICKVNLSSVNTLRVVTQFFREKAQMKVCVMRMGRMGKKVDNSHQGGLSVQIDINNGSFYPYATAEHGGGKYYEHPDSQFVFKGSKIEGWNEIKATIEEYASLFPELKDIAWDVAVTPNGIEMIELNLGYGIAHLQCTCGGMRRILDIYPKN